MVTATDVKRVTVGQREGFSVDDYGARATDVENAQLTALRQVVCGQGRRRFECQWCCTRHCAAHEGPIEIQQAQLHPARLEEVGQQEMPAQSFAIQGAHLFRVRYIVHRAHRAIQPPSTTRT